ncbi:carboxypeptidase-like regulatory domain-containing protein [Sphingobacterium sp. E70]|uniref:carboxypeptidase-like regulatory domain-containing protein n=1 Tax=Sphingobacterium sp. E70 TaxID=2853439 RepID=UPI00211CB953|nr:carboxypeptidase-like regulatory domain-containing protein [Sphingobacterium sp. E70]ULT25681.1 carboxypeptidase-like regulatory domain-containing protein [Sphingobacterium sp. E70]
MRNNCKLKQNRFYRFGAGTWMPCSCLLCLVSLAAPATALKANVPSDSIVSLGEQNREITGKISDSNGQPLAGVTVNVPGSNISAASKADGTYAISVPLDAKNWYSSCWATRARKLT